MSPHNSSQSFSPGVTWLGIIILSSALATSSSTPALAATGGLATWSMTWTGIDTKGVLRGGTPVDYSSGLGGWGGPAFDSAGVMGIEWTTVPDPTRRVTYLPSTATPSVSPGAESSVNTVGYLTPMPSQVLAVKTTTRVSGDQAHWSVRLESTAPDAMEGNRFFWIADLPEGYDSVFSNPQSQALVVRDSLGRYPTMVLHATSTAGTVIWGGPDRYTTALTDGHNKPTLYVYDTTEMDITVTITAGIIDHDPCSGPAALAVANANVNVYGTTWPTITSCLSSPSWTSVGAGADPSVLSIPLDPRVPALAPNQTRVLDITGLPAGVTWTSEDFTGNTLSLQLAAEASVTPGNYPLGFEVRTRTDSNSVVSLSESLRTSGTLSIDPAPPAPEPEPEPTPEPEEETEPEAEVTVVPEEVASEGSSPQPTTSAAEPEVVLEAAPTRRAPQSPAPTEEVAPAFIPRSTPAERELFTPDPKLPLSPPSFPEPSNASAWLGISVAIAAALSGIFALLRRRPLEEEE